ncbi:sulfurtransferase complex subunit TusB [Arenicellales bacterium nBUS_48]|jgi:tRNA 2-thiouridine synthesizing protein B|nr:sulfurtransferase complex subunit TusB [Pseudomonadota bacterium]MBT7110611.1 sulfurtransferase complex subunit TusB [Pseudomonadota bacterium]MBT7967310.1 sulfurtransferase complex subunit TusB [Pseudomonadota bacterium]MCP4950924.1 sulfurtransferase complex subunit TusB [Pseudomonadota bacterium]MDB4826560.1 sulfurtransferase complex subunit TusB [Gammaproteobacteria bacterium]
MLHTVNKSPYDSSSLRTCLSLAKSGSDLLLIEDGVYGALSGSVHSDSIAEALNSLKVYALGPDLKARGISEDRLVSGIQVVGYDGFVELATGNDKVQSWL